MDYFLLLCNHGICILHYYKNYNSDLCADTNSQRIFLLTTKVTNYCSYQNNLFNIGNYISVLLSFLSSQIINNSKNVCLCMYIPTCPLLFDRLKF